MKNSHLSVVVSHFRLPESLLNFEEIARIETEVGDPWEVFLPTNLLYSLSLLRNIHSYPVLFVIFIHTTSEPIFANEDVLK